MKPFGSWRPGHGAWLAALLVAGAALAAQEMANKQLIVEFFAFSGSREERAAQYMTPDYVQHNPRFLRMDAFTGATGSQAWIAAFEEAQRRGGLQLVALGGIPLRNPIILLADGDLVHAVYRGTRPVPGEPDRTYEAFAFESFRVRDGKFSEHWDQVRLEPGWMSPRPPAAARGRGNGGQAPAGGRGRGAATAPPVPQPPASCTATPAQLEANRRLALSFLQGPMTPDALRARAALLAPDFVEHSPPLVAFNARAGVAGRAGFVAAAERGAVTIPDEGAPRTVDHVVAECDYVSVVWRQTLPDPDAPSRSWEAFTFDALRIREGQIAERWDGRGL